MRGLLEEKYKELLNLLGMEVQTNGKEMNSIIQKSIREFTQQCKNPAIWCNGKHTKMLMADFMFELKKVHYIIDNGLENLQGAGFEVIRDNQIEEKEIDGVIISSKIYREDIWHAIEENHKQIKYLDIYSKLEEAGIFLNTSYYMVEHPYYKYSFLNQLQRSVRTEKNEEALKDDLKKIIAMYVKIKDFRSALHYIDKWSHVFSDRWRGLIKEKLKELYHLQIAALKRMGESNVLMLCIDGLRRQDVLGKNMVQLYDYMKENMCSFWNAYSVSTSTFESLIPAYSENDDLRSQYYRTNCVGKGQCRFIRRAKEQGRHIFFYTDGTKYVEEDGIKINAWTQTATEKMWDFTLDGTDEKNGLFYIHVLYESHFSWLNPYTKEKLFMEDTSILFDYLEINGGKIRADYEQQHRDALQYLNDVMVPLLEALRCRIVLYANHGNLLIDKNEKLENIEGTKFTFHEDLIQVPLGIKAPEVEVEINNSLRTIMDLNEIVIDLLEQRKIELKERPFIKVLRSSLYNPNFHYVYKKSGNEHGLLAFEVFIFPDDYKLAVYSDGTVDLFSKKTDERLNDTQVRNLLLDRVRDKITVCNNDKIPGKK